MGKWEENALKVVCEVIFSGGTPSTSIPEYWNGDLFWLSSGETNQRFIYKTDKTITEMGVANSSTRLAKKNDIVMACAGQGKTRGQTSTLVNDMYINQSVIALRPKLNKVEPRFLFYTLSMKYDELRQLSDAGSTRGSITTDMLKKLKMKFPDLPTQTRIADILSAYDDLIENNNRRIELLEKAAQELYKEWFVRFRFSNHENKKFVNGLPEGWVQSKFKDNLSFITGKLDSNATTDNGKYDFYTCAKTIYKTDTYYFEGECVLLGGNNATGDFSLFYANSKLDAYQRTYIVTPLNSTIGCPYIFFVLKDYLDHFKQSSAGAATKFLTKRILDNLSIIIADEPIMLEFNKISKNLFDEIIILQKQNQNLKKQRDLLLLRLMSGRLEV